MQLKKIISLLLFTVPNKAIPHWKGQKLNFQKKIFRLKNLQAEIWHFKSRCLLISRIRRQIRKSLLVNYFQKQYSKVPAKLRFCEK